MGCQDPHPIFCTLRLEFSLLDSYNKFNIFYCPHAPLQYMSAHCTLLVSQYAHIHEMYKIATTNNNGCIVSSLLTSPQTSIFGQI